MTKNLNQDTFVILAYRKLELSINCILKLKHVKWAFEKDYLF